MSYNCMGAAPRGRGYAGSTRAGTNVLPVAGTLFAPEEPSAEETRAVTGAIAAFSRGGSNVVRTPDIRAGLKNARGKRGGFVTGASRSGSAGAEAAATARGIRSIFTLSNPAGTASGMPNIGAAALRMRAGYVPLNTNSSLVLTAGGNLATLGALPLDPLRPVTGAPDRSTRYALWKARAYSQAPMPGLGLDFSSIIGGAGGSGGLVSLFVKSPEQKAAESAAKAQEKAAKAQIKAAKLAAGTAAGTQDTIKKVAYIGAAVAALGIGAYFIFGRKKR